MAVSGLTTFAPLLAAGLALAACAPAAPARDLAAGGVGTIRFATTSPTSRQFALGEAGPPAVVTGDLHLPAGAGPFPAVVLVHGSGGVGPNVAAWTRELLALGVASFELDSFGGRGIRETATDQSRLSSGAMVLDAYRALELLAGHPAIDRARIAVMGFSKGGFVALYTSNERFARRALPAGLRFAAHLPFYPPCNVEFVDDTVVSGRPIRIFHGEDDNWTRIGPCRRYVERLRQAGVDAQIFGYPGARHAFDVPRAPGVVTLRVQSGADCDLVERRPAVLFHRDGSPAVPGDPCIGWSATVAYDAAAHRAAQAAVREFLTTTFRPAR